MKKLLLTLGVAALVFTACDNTPKYTIKGSIKNLDANKIYLKEYRGGQAIVIDSADVKKGEFVMKGTANNVVRCGLFVGKDAMQKSFANLYLENSPITVTFDANNKVATKITGGVSQELRNQFDAIDFKMVDIKSSLNGRYNAVMQDKENLQEKEIAEKVNQIRQDYSKAEANINKEKIALIKANPSSLVSAHIFADIYRLIDVKEAKNILNSLTGEAASNEFTSIVKARIAILEKVAVGQPAPDFTLNTPDGKSLSLSSFKGKILVLDFWASWCGPCRQENPNVVKMYKKYHKKGLEILGVSLDTDKTAWQKAIKDDGLTWKHVSDLKGWGSSVAKLYAVNGIPHVILIDKEGKIVAKNLRGEALEAKIREYIK